MGASEKPVLLQTEGLRRDFPMGHTVVHALDGVNLTVEEGEFLGVMGPSGSGKSTLLHLLGGLDRPTAGHIWVRGRDLTVLDENELAAYRRREVGFIFQSFYLVPTMTALQNVEFPMLFARVPPARRRERALYLLERVGLADRRHHRPTELSGGEQQRVAIARALANDPILILADEPTGNLDSRTGAEVMQLLAELNAEGRTVILVSHDLAMIAYTRRHIRMLDGRIVGED
ncbi:MAG: ABC transporter ATP-binding protein [Anaerolineae bacterium]|nr:ABC transporter ATP-binding protein [Anaerolineae bacterium]MDW7991434.1 ABC transporter ATP-binding protein [Anaerolineae bacterium]